MYVAMKKAPRSIEFQVPSMVGLGRARPYTARKLDVPHPCSGGSWARMRGILKL